MFLLKFQDSKACDEIQLSAQTLPVLLIKTSNLKITPTFQLQILQNKLKNESLTNFPFKKSHASKDNLQIFYKVSSEVVEVAVLYRLFLEK